MKLETKQNEVRLVAESDIESYFLDKFFNEKKKLFCYKDEKNLSEEVYRVRLTYEKE